MAVAEKSRTNGAPRKGVPASGFPAAPPLAVGVVRKRRPVRVVVGGAVVLLCAMVGALALAAVDHRKPVLVVTTTIQPGQVITPGDLGFAHVAGQGLATTSDPAGGDRQGGVGAAAGGQSDRAGGVERPVAGGGELGRVAYGVEGRDVPARLGGG